MIGYELKMH